ncbi:MAG: FtsH protease activity modulator HflK [Thiobacillaceae bacterium]
MAWNDPQWGKNNNAGPPDLDELWRRLNQRLSGLFGGKGGGGGDEGSGPSLPKNLVGLVLALTFLVWVASGFYIVDAGSKGIVLRFGKYTETTEPGARWHLPWPIESHEIVNVSSVRTLEVGYSGSARNKKLSESLMLTDEQNIVDLQFAVQYILKDAKDYLFNNQFDDDTEIVKQVAESAMRDVVGKSRMDFVLYEGRAEVAARAKKLMQQILDRYKTGISISQVTLQNVQPPEQVQASFDDAVKANQDRERLKNEAQAYANDVVPRATGVASRLQQESEGYRQAVIANSEGEASRFSQIEAQYKKAPVVTRERIYLDNMQQVLTNTSKVIVDQKGGSNLLYLPLNKLQEMSSQPSLQAPEVLAPPATVTPPASESDTAPSRSRDAFRSRDREDRP